MNTPAPPSPVRYDLNQDGVIGLGDILTINPFFNSSCTMLPPHKTLFAGRWYHGSVCPSPCSISWMTPPTEKTILCPSDQQATCTAKWDPALSLAVDGDGKPGNGSQGWNETSNTVYYSWQPLNYYNDVRIFVANFAPDWLGLSEVYDRDYVYCGADKCPNNTWYWQHVQLNHHRFTGAYDNENLRRAATTHELGHGISLAHDGLGPAATGFRDGLCGPPGVPQTIMDYDCVDAGITIAPWDDCGVNHAYQDPNWGFAGC